MSELKVNKVSPQSGTDFTLGDSGDTFTVPSGATLTVAGTLTQTGAQTFDGGVDIDNFNINGTTIALSSGNMTIDAQGNDTDIIFKGTDGSADTTFLTIDGSAAGAATFNNAITSGAVITSGAGLVIADTGNIGSASDTDAIAIAADGVVTFSQVPLLPDNTVATADIQADAITGAKIADDAINSEHYTDGSIDTAHIADGQVTTAKLATAVLTGATDIGAAIADADLLLVDDGAGGTLRKTAASRLKTYITDNTPAFAAKIGGDQTIAHNTSTKLALNNEIFDTDSKYNTSNYRFTPTVPGKYFCTLNINFNGGSAANLRIANAQIYFNGSLAYISGFDKANGYENNGRESLSAIITFDDDDYIEPYAYGFTQDSGNIVVGGNNTYDALFSAFKLIGV